MMGPMDATRILVVDDEPIVREVLARYLEREGYAVEVAEDGERAIERYRATAPDLVLLDLMLPRIDGLEVFRRMRDNRRDTPRAAVIMLTAKGDEADRIVGLELGADDYVTKPFSPREVVARVRAVLRRGGGATPDGDALLSFDDLEIDVHRREVRRRGRLLHLTRKEFDLMHLLTSSPGHTFTRAELLEEVWDFAWSGDSDTVTVHVRRLRQKIEVDPSAPRRLVTVWGVGYRFEP